MRSPAFYYRGGIAVVSAISGLVALYLHRLKVSSVEIVDPFAICDVGGGCTIVQNSPWGWFFGVDVALIGALGNAAIFLMSIAGIQSRWVGARWPTVALMMLVYPAVLFVARLKYAEFVVLQNFCPWCAIPTVAIAICAVLVTLDARRREGVGAGLR